jgi:hypothetical protein
MIDKPLKIVVASTLLSRSIAEIDGEYYFWEGNEELSTEKVNSTQLQQIETEYASQLAAYPMGLLREERNKRIAETDWWVVSDRTATAEQLAYRQALRDITENSTPSINEYDQLINVTWPVKP